RASRTLINDRLQCLLGERCAPKISECARDLAFPTVLAISVNGPASICSLVERPDLLAKQRRRRSKSLELNVYISAVRSEGIFQPAIRYERIPIRRFPFHKFFNDVRLCCHRIARQLRPFLSHIFDQMPKTVCSRCARGITKLMQHAIKIGFMLVE